MHEEMNMRGLSRIAAILLAAGVLLTALCSFAATPVVSPDSPSARIMGQYEGIYTGPDGKALKAEADVLAQGKGTYFANLRAFRADGSEEMNLDMQRAPSWLQRLLTSERRVKMGVIIGGVRWTGRIGEGKFTAAPAKAKRGEGFVLNRVVRHSPTEGLKPTPGAVVLLPYAPDKPTTLTEWTNQNWKILPDGSVQVARGDSKSVRKFGDCRLHAEFWLPFEPLGRGQGRGNSGVYLQDLYEVQVLDSFGLPSKNNECGGIYSIAAPKVNMCFPPLRWQTYDITFRAPRFGPDGKVVEPATFLKLVHNGVTIHENIKAPRSTERSKPGGEVKAGPIRLQNHGHPVRFRNFWIVELKDEGK